MLTLKDKFPPPNNENSIYPPPCRLKVRCCFVVLKTFLELKILPDNMSKHGDEQGERMKKMFPFLPDIVRHCLD